MVAHGKKSDLDFKVSANAEKAIGDLGRIIARQEGVIRKTRESTAESKKAQREMRKALKAVENGSAGAANGVRKVKHEMSAIGRVSETSLKGISAWIGGFASVAGIAMSIRAITDSMKEVAELQKKFRDSAITREQITKEAAALDPRGINKVTMRKTEAEQDKLASEAGLTVRESAKIQLMSRSKYGVTQKAIDSASVVGQLAATGVPSEQLKGMPNIFELYGAETKEQMLGVANQVYKGYRNSTATAGQFMDAFQRIAPVSAVQGVPIENTIADLVAMIDKTASTVQAAEQIKISQEAAFGKTEKSIEWQSEKASKLGLDFQSMKNPERQAFTLDIVWGTMAAGNADELKSIYDTAGLRGLMVKATPGYQKTYKSTKDEIIAAKDSKDLQDAVKYHVSNSMGARKAAEENQLLSAEARSGRESEPMSALDSHVDSILDLHKERKDKSLKDVFYDWVSVGQKGHQTARTVLLQNLGVAYDQATTDAEREEIRKLQEDVHYTNVFDFNHNLQETVFKKTEGYSLVKKHGYLPYDEDDVIRYGNGNIDQIDLGGFTRRDAAANYYGVDPLATKESVELLKQISDKLDKQTQAIERRLPEFSNPSGGLD